jgi:multiple antibiotic resistance protein
MISIDFSFLWLAAIGIFAIVNPFSTAIVFLGLTEKTSEKLKIKMAEKATITCALILGFFIVTGSLIFDFFGITLEAFQIAGGLLITRLGFGMLYPKAKLDNDEHKESKKKQDISLIPLAIPFLSGPGAIATTLVWASEAPSWMETTGLVIVVALISLIAYVILINARVLNKLFGKTGINVIEKLMGLIVLVMGIQFVINALRTLIPSLLGN